MIPKKLWNKYCLIQISCSHNHYFRRKITVKQQPSSLYYHQTTQSNIRLLSNLLYTQYLLVQDHFHFVHLLQVLQLIQNHYWKLDITNQSAQHYNQPTIQHSNNHFIGSHLVLSPIYKITIHFAGWSDFFFFFAEPKINFFFWELYALLPFWENWTKALKPPSTAHNWISKLFTHQSTHRWWALHHICNNLWVYLSTRICSTSRLSNQLLFISTMITAIIIWTFKMKMALETHN